MAAPCPATSGGTSQRTITDIDRQLAAYQLKREKTRATLRGTHEPGTTTFLAAQVHADTAMINRLLDERSALLFAAQIGYDTSVVTS